MNDKIRITLPIVPPRTTSQSKRAARTAKGIRFFATRGHTADCARLDAALFCHRRATPLDGALRVSIGLVYPWHDSDSRRTRQHPIVPHSTKPDWDNVAKAICDALETAGIVANDSRISIGTLMKARGTHPRIEVIIEPLTSDGLRYEWEGEFGPVGDGAGLAQAGLEGLSGARV